MCGKMFYHIVTREKMQLGQVIDFSKEEKNHLYHFFLGNQFKNKNGKSFFEILQTESDLNGNREFLTNVAGHDGRAVREIITEMVRLENFPFHPSRFKCLYATQNQKDLQTWIDNFSSFNRRIEQVIKIQSEGPFFYGNADLLPDPEHSSFIEMLEQATTYWNTPL